MTDLLFRYYKEDFGNVPVTVIHMDLVFDVFDDHTKVTSDLHAESRDRLLSELALNAKNLEILAVSCPGQDCSYEVSIMMRHRQVHPPSRSPSASSGGSSGWSRVSTT